MSAKLRWIEAPRRVPPSAEAFLGELGGPVALAVPGRETGRARAVATLLHGNEPSGLRAIHAWLRRGIQPRVDTLFVIGAVEAARAAPGFAHRALPGRRDLNRCFREPFTGPEGELAAQILTALRHAAPEALIDLHNTTGHTPAYGVGPSADPTCLGLVSLFGDRFVHNDLALGALVEATDPDFPSVTIECGRAGDERADAVALDGLARYLEIESVAAGDAGLVRVLAHPVRVRVRYGTRVAYADAPVRTADLTVAAGVDRHNFALVGPDTPIGWLTRDDDWPVEAHGADGREISRELFSVGQGVLRPRRPLVAIMMTTDPAIAASDCLFYVVDTGAR